MIFFTVAKYDASNLIIIDLGADSLTMIYIYIYEIRIMMTIGHSNTDLQTLWVVITLIKRLET